MVSIAKRLTQLPPDWLLIKKLLVTCSLVSWILTILYMVCIHYFGLNPLQHDTKSLSFHYPWNIVYILVAILNTVALICLARNELNYITAIWFAVLGIVGVYWNTHIEGRLFKRLVLVQMSIVFIWLAYDLVLIRWNSHKKEGNEAPDEEEDKDEEKEN